MNKLIQSSSLCVHKKGFNFSENMMFTRFSIRGFTYGYVSLVFRVFLPSSDSQLRPWIVLKLFIIRKLIQSPLILVYKTVLYRNLFLHVSKQDNAQCNANFILFRRAPKMGPSSDEPWYLKPISSNLRLI